MRRDRGTACGLAELVARDLEALYAWVRERLAERDARRGPAA